MNGLAIMQFHSYTKIERQLKIFYIHIREILYISVCIYVQNMLADILLSVYHTSYTYVPILKHLSVNNFCYKVSIYLVFNLQSSTFYAGFGFIVYRKWHHSIQMKLSISSLLNDFLLLINVNKTYMCSV